MDGKTQRENIKKHDRERETERSRMKTFSTFFDRVMHNNKYQKYLAAYLKHGMLAERGCNFVQIAKFILRSYFPEN